MRIIHVIDSLTDMSAGPTKSVVALANHQCIDGHEVTIITSSGEHKNYFNFNFSSSLPFLKILMLCWEAWLQFLKGRASSKSNQKLLLSICMEFGGHA